MDYLFLILLLASLVGFIWGTIKPKSLSRHIKKNISRKHFSLIFGCLAIAFFILVGVSAPKQTARNQTINLTSAKSSVKPSPIPIIQTKTVIQTKSIAYTNTNVQDSSLASGTTKITTQGVNGVETLTYKNTYTNNRQTASDLESDVITTKPINQITSVGTYVAPPPTQANSTPQQATSCYPLTNGGNCYEPGEYCRTSDQGTSGVAGDGKTITCENNDGWRWEPS